MGQARDDGATTSVMSVEGVLFDLDDTLIDWWGSINESLRQFADDAVIDALLQHVRDSWWECRPGTDHVWHRNTWALHQYRHDVWRDALPHIDDAELALLLADFDRTLWVGFFDDVVPTLDLLVDHGRLRLGVLSNNHLLEQEAQRLRLPDWFDVLVSAQQPFVKPHPDAFHRGCRHLGTAPERTVYVGDSVKADALGALSAGLVPVWIDRWDDPWPDRPSDVHRITALSQLPDLLAAF